MNTTTCPKCGKLFRGSTCPQCGYSVNGGSVVDEETVKKELQPEEIVEESPKHIIITEFVKCNDCGKIYKGNLEACPQCGYPTDQQPLMPTNDENIPINVTDILSIKEDKFEETKDIEIFPRRHTSCSIGDLCKSLGVDSPVIFLAYHVEKGVGQLQVCYFEAELLKKIESIHDKDLADKYGWACRRMIINIDDKENIRLDLANNESIWEANFPITQEQFLKCCNAKKLEFKITKENGEFIIVNGYFGFDPETGAEIDLNGDVVPENDLILNFRVLYNYMIDSNMFTDALRKRQMYDELIKRKNEKIKASVKKEKAIEVEDNNSQGTGWLLIGVLAMVIGLIMFISGFSDTETPQFIIGLALFIFGIFPLVFGISKMQGKSNEEAWEALKKVGEAMGH